MSANARFELWAWLALFDQRKHELIAAGMTPEDAEEQASREIRRRIRHEGFREAFDPMPLVLTREMVDEVIEDWERDNPGKSIFRDLTPETFGALLVAKIKAAAHEAPTHRPHQRRQ